MEPASHREIGDGTLRLRERLHIDINFHPLAESGRTPPHDYQSSFRRPSGIGVLDAAVAGRIAACAGLHNRIVHEYEELDPAKVFDAIQTALRNIPVYLEAVNEFVVRR